MSHGVTRVHVERSAGGTISGEYLNASECLRNQACIFVIRSGHPVPTFISFEAKLQPTCCDQKEDMCNELVPPRVVTKGGDKNMLHYLLCLLKAGAKRLLRIANHQASVLPTCLHNILCL